MAKRLTKEQKERLAAIKRSNKAIAELNNLDHLRKRILEDTDLNQLLAEESKSVGPCVTSYAWSTFIKSLKHVQKLAHYMAVQKGWWDRPRSAGVIYSNLHGELSEAWECVCREQPEFYLDPTTKKPEGEVAELADLVIRLFDYAGKNDWDLGTAIKMKMEYNAKRSYRHGNKKY